MAGLPPGLRVTSVNMVSASGNQLSYDVMVQAERPLTFPAGALSFTPDPDLMDLMDFFRPRYRRDPWGRCQ